MFPFLIYLERLSLIGSSCPVKCLYQLPCGTLGDVRCPFTKQYNCSYTREITHTPSRHNRINALRSYSYCCLVVTLGSFKFISAVTSGRLTAKMVCLSTHHVSCKTGVLQKHDAQFQKRDALGVFSHEG